VVDVLTFDRKLIGGRTFQLHSKNSPQEAACHWPYSTLAVVDPKKRCAMGTWGELTTKLNNESEKDHKVNVACMARMFLHVGLQLLSEPCERRKAISCWADGRDNKG
jgi:hypothetical protein